MGKTTIKWGTELEQFWKLLPAGAEQTLLALELSDDGETVVQVPGLGRVLVWLDACSEGEDRGGHVRWVRLCDVVTEDATPVTLEGEPDDSRLLFGGRDLDL